MVNKILNFINKEISGLHEAAYLLAFFAFLSQIMALVRDRLLAHTFGASHALDLYYAAFRIPDFLFASVGSLVSISVLVPFFAEKLEKSTVETKEFIDHTFSIFFFTIGGIAALCFIFAHQLVPVVLPGFAKDPQLPQLITLMRIMLLSPILLGFSNFFSSITQMYNRFLIYALSPLLYNLGIIMGVVLLYPIFGLKGLAIGVAIGAAMHFSIQIPYVIEKGMFPKITWRINWAAIKKVVLLSFPRTLALTSNELSELILVAMASFMSSGSISIFNYSFNLQSVPLSIVGVSYTSAAFPLLSKLFSSGNRKAFLEQMIVSSQHIIFWSTPVMIFFTVLRAQIVRVILGSGQFNWTDTRLTAACLAVFTISIIPQSLIILFVRAYYSNGKTTKPMIINLISSGLIIVFAYTLIKLYTVFPYFQYFIEALFKVDSVPGTVVLMLPLAYSFGVFTNTIVHWIAFHRDYPGFTRPVLKTFFRSMSAAIIMGYVIYLFLGIFGNIFNINTVFGIFLQGFCSGIIGIASCVGMLKLLNSQELESIWKTLHSKIWKANIIIPEATEI